VPLPATRRVARGRRLPAGAPHQPRALHHGRRPRYRAPALCARLPRARHPTSGATISSASAPSTPLSTPCAAPTFWPRPICTFSTTASSAA
jgi:hypothetical protein